STSYKTTTNRGRSCETSRNIVTVFLPETQNSAHPCHSMESLTFECWVYGDDVGRIFPAEIARNKTVGDLKEVIKNKNPVDFRDLDARALDLYSIILLGDDQGLEAELKKLTLD
ncbi:hypothetical protein PAXRUDRAFT_238843, partial [Paxillus rubicundulus Ve08.2h10]